MGIKFWGKQNEIINSVRDNARTVVFSCNASGKTYAAAKIAVWFLWAYSPAVIITTAPTFKQVKNQLWRYIRTTIDEAPYKDLIFEGVKVNQVELEVSTNCYALGMATGDSPSEMEDTQGFHAPKILWMLDEASGVTPTVYEAVEGGMMGEHARLLLIGNPTRQTGDFADAMKSPLYKRIHIAAKDTPNFREGVEQLSGTITPEWAANLIQKYGKDSDIVRVRVHGLPPKQEEDTIIPIHLVELAQMEPDEDEDDTDGDEYIGLDVARFGDDSTSFVRRKKRRAKLLEKIYSSNLVEVQNRAAYWLRQYPKAILRVDTIGIGAGVYDNLTNSEEYADIADRVEGVNVALPAEDDEHYANKRAEAWFNKKKWLTPVADGGEGGHLEKDEGWIELSHPKYKINSRGKIQVESKDEIKKRSKNSPDQADALGLTLVKGDELPYTPIAFG